LNHIAEKIAIDNRNISFYSINALFRQKKREVSKSPGEFEGSYIIRGFVEKQRSDRLRTKGEDLYVIFRLDRHDNIIVITAFSASDKA